MDVFSICSSVGNIGNESNIHEAPRFFVRAIQMVLLIVKSAAENNIRYSSLFFSINPGDAVEI